MVNVGEYNSAHEYTKKALELFNELGDRVGMAWAYHILGRIELNTKNYTLMKEYYHQSLRLHGEQQNKTGFVYTLEGFAHLAVAQNRLERGVRLFGAAEALREQLRFPLPCPDRAEYEKGVAAARAQLDEASFIKAWTLGRALSLERAIAEAQELARVKPSSVHHCKP
jgi:hypothetical protein